jgi:hypothetical protein
MLVVRGPVTDPGAPLQVLSPVEGPASHNDCKWSLCGHGIYTSCSSPPGRDQAHEHMNRASTPRPRLGTVVSSLPSPSPPCLRFAALILPFRSIFVLRVTLALLLSTRTVLPWPPSQSNHIRRCHELQTVPIRCSGPSAFISTPVLQPMKKTKQKNAVSGKLPAGFLRSRSDYTQFFSNISNYSHHIPFLSYSALCLSFVVVARLSSQKLGSSTTPAIRSIANL